MKYLFYTILIIACITACNKNEDKSAQVETRSATGVTNVEATCWGKITEQGSNGIKEYGIELNNFGDTEKIPYTITKADSFGVRITGLEKGISYTYRAYAIENNENIKYGNYMEFTTLVPAEFYVLATNITSQSADIQFTNTEQLREWGLYFGTTNPATTEDTKIEAKGEQVIKLTGLEPYTYYYILAYALDKKGASATIESSFITDFVQPQLSKPVSSNITISGATISFEVVNFGGNQAVISECGVQYSTNGQTWTKKRVTYAEGTLSFTLTGLTPATKYFIQAYAQNNGAKEGYSETVEITTAGSIPTLAKPTITALKSYKTNMGGGKVTNEGQLSITEYGFCWSTTTGQAVATGNNFSKVTTGNKDAFDYLSYVLLANTKYYVRAYAKNQAGIGYSEEVAVTTPAIVYGSVQDRWDGTNYKTVQIGNQTWMVENLKNNGNGSRTFSLNDVKTHMTNACPTGWHIPTQTEYEDLITEVGGKTIAPITLREKNEWLENGTNTTGFSIIPLQCGNPLYNCNNYWTSTLYVNPNQYQGYYYFRVHSKINGTEENAYFVNEIDNVSFPVRCIKD